MDNSSRPVAFQQSYGRAASAVILWLIALVLPSAGLPKFPLDGKAVGGLTFVTIFAAIGVAQFVVAVRLRRWSDTFVFGIGPALLFVVVLLYAHLHR
jgi:hypothetical protein